ncbi:MAG: hypothetical protein D6681_20180 [Calditrichaeota bacterium]|nr:MAG: hypothetical protein D6681_20180 [Calditrichota bacterium]
MGEKTETLLKRARELAALAEKATPGPWHAYDRGTGWDIEETEPPIRGMFEQEADARLAAAAPEMARLLCEMADLLECLLPAASACPADPPDYIWLQWHGDETHPQYASSVPRDEDVTWSRERIYEHDALYIRAGLVNMTAKTTKET